MSTERRNKDKSMAAHLKSRGVIRSTGTCPMGCRASIPNGGERLIAHLGACRRPH